MTKIGFTGSRRGLSSHQKQAFAAIVEKYAPFELHHGDCVGADEYANNWYYLYEIKGKKIVIHPPINDKLRAFCHIEVNWTVDDILNETEFEIREEKDYLDRNQDIVDETDFLVAFPNREPTGGGHKTGGTWDTIRRARRQGKKVIITYVNGKQDVLDN